MLLLGFLGWWLTRSAVRWRDRWQAVAAVVLILIAASLVADKTDEYVRALHVTFPTVHLHGLDDLALRIAIARADVQTGRLRASRCYSPFGYFDLLRWDGLEATQKPEMSWRWIPTKETSFLASHRGAEKSHRRVPAEANHGHRNRAITSSIEAQIAMASSRAFRSRPTGTTHPPKLLWRKKVGPAGRA